MQNNQKPIWMTYAKKSLVKPVLAAFGVAVLFATHGVSEAADQAGGPLSNLTAMLGGAGNLDCASPDVKQIITDNVAETFAETAIPDLVWAIERKRITFRVEMITETGRSKTSPFVNCKGNLVVAFPEEDLNKAKKLLGDGGLAGIYAEAIRRTGPVLNEPIVYRVSIPADKEERKNGPLVEMRFVNPQRASDTITVYGAAYGTLAGAAPDVSASTKNSVKWDREFHDGVIQECGKQANAALCRCKIEQFAQVLKQEDFQRISFLVQAKTLDADKYRNFIALSDALNKQCPLPQRIASVLAPSRPAAPAPVVEPAKPVVQAAPVPTPAAPATQPAQATITASFDCAKASSKIEKLVCSTPQSADADRRLASAYRTAAAKATDLAALKQQQRDWLKERNACGDTACLLKTTEARIQALSAI